MQDPPGIAAFLTRVSTMDRAELTAYHNEDRRKDAGAAEGGGEEAAGRQPKARWRFSRSYSSGGTGRIRRRSGRFRACVVAMISPFHRNR